MHDPQPSDSTKEALRAAIRRRLEALDPAVRESDSRRILDHARALPEWTAARRIALFVPRADEPDILPLLRLALESGKEPALPAYDPARDAYLFRAVPDPSALRTGKYGIPEPDPGLPEVPAGALDLAFVPGICFSPDGGRLGRGRGFYDRLLLPFRGISCGVGFDFQVVPATPVESHDVKLHLILTPVRLLAARVSG
jgi:5-formyltetrahydrofolate cyclo-ligase